MEPAVPELYCPRDVNITCTVASEECLEMNVRAAQTDGYTSILRIEWRDINFANTRVNLAEFLGNFSRK